jgi:hypothetical protein
MGNAEIVVSFVYHKQPFRAMMWLLMLIPKSILVRTEPRIKSVTWKWKGVYHLAAIPYIVPRKHDEQQTTQTRQTAEQGEA